jgi:uncharacterized protein YodC (DUF2158 family)
MSSHFIRFARETKERAIVKEGGPHAIVHTISKIQSRRRHENP